MYLLWAVLLWLIWMGMGPWLHRAGPLRMLIGVVPLSFVTSVVSEALWVVCFPQLPLSHAHKGFWERFQYYLAGEVIDGVFIFWGVFLLFRGIDYYIRYREKEETAARLQGQLAQAQIHALRMHLNPHFLFNTLNAISGLMRLDVSKADLMLEQFSILLRMTLERGDVQLIRLCEEMEFVEMYMTMQDLRFAGRIRNRVEIDPELHDALIPVMILQPVVENAYTHGLSLTTGPGELTLTARREGTEVRIQVTNTGPVRSTGRPPAAPTWGHGLKNVNRRLELHYPNRHTFSLSETFPGVVSVAMTLPFELGHSCEDDNHKPAYGA